MNWESPSEVREYKHRWNLANKERLKILKAEYYQKYKSRIDHKNKQNTRIRIEKYGIELEKAKRRDWASRNRGRLKEIQNRWRIKHPEKCRAYWQKKSLRYRTKHKETLSQKKKLYYQKNREMILDKVKARGPVPNRKDYVRKWYSENPHKIFLYSSKRRALERAAAINLSGLEFFVKDVKLREHCFCFYCGAKIPSVSCHFDHIIPLSKGGQHSADNLCTSCPTCNFRKGTRLISQWNGLPKLLWYDL